MDNIKNASGKYLELLKERAKNSRIYKPHQLTGLTLAELLEDPEHKSLYMKLATIYDNGELVRLAKNLTERKNIANKGAYFMKLLKASDMIKI